MKTISTTFKRNLAVLIIIASAVIYFNCDDAGTVVAVTDYCISGQISGWTLGAKTLHADIRNKSGASFLWATCPIDAAGNFNICLSSAVPDSTLYASDSLFYSGCAAGGTATFNPSDSRGTEIFSLKVYDGDTAIGTLRKKNYTTLTAGSFYLVYIYANKNVSASGWKYCGNDTLSFDGAAVTGWNKIVKNYTRVDTTAYSILYNTTEPPGATWKYTSYTDEIYMERDYHR